MNIDEGKSRDLRHTNTMMDEESSGTRESSNGSSPASDIQEPAVTITVRRRGRGRGRPARQGRGRGSRQTTSAQRRDTNVLSLLTDRRNTLKDRVRHLNDDDILEILLDAAEIYTSMTAELLDRKERGNASSGGFRPSGGGSTSSWCTCNKCREMPTDAGKVCCGKLPASCTSLMPDLQVLILDDAVLRLVQLYRQDVLVVRDINREYRHSAYRQYIMDCIGAGVRKTIPSCCVWAIRDKYPDQFRQYVGFVPSRIL